MKRYISLALSSTLIMLALPRGAEAAPFDESSSRHQSRASLVDAGRMTLSSGWHYKYSVYSDSNTGVVFGDGYAEDPQSVDTTGSAGRWLSYTLEDGHFVFLGVDDGVPFRASFGPDDVTWSWDPESGWGANIQHPDAGPQASIWLVAVVVVAAAVLLSGDSRCSCGHNGGAENHPGTNHPE